jgi:hypothetical protein
MCDAPAERQRKESPYCSRVAPFQGVTPRPPVAPFSRVLRKEG